MNFSCLASVIIKSKTHCFTTDKIDQDFQTVAADIKHDSGGLSMLTSELPPPCVRQLSRHGAEGVRGESVPAGYSQQFHRLLTQ